jgi:Metallo-peptidase family M12/Domain of unknown function DUF11
MGARRGNRADVRIGWWFVVAVAMAAPSVAPSVAFAAARDGDTRILHFEPLDRASLASSVTTLRKSDDGTRRQLQFDAYSRTFTLNVDTNDALHGDVARVQSKLRNPTLQLYQGQIDGAARSWVRLALKGDELHGMLWDGTEMYVIEPVAQVLDALASPPDDASATVIFRLADVVMNPAATACAAQTTSASGAVALNTLMAELKGTPALMEAAGPSRELRISALGDAPFLRGYAGLQDARDAILMRLNNVDGIFSSQLGIRIRVDGLYVNDAASDPLSDATAPNSLLAELGKLRKRSPELYSRGLTHLFTGRELDGTTIGIAYVDSLCQAEQGVGLTQVQSAWRDSLVAAHEVAHNFGADHDGEASGSCPAAPAGFLMAASVNGNDQFSQCSLDRMRPRADAAKCITALPPANVAVPHDLGTVHQALAASFAWDLLVSNSGGLSAADVRAELLVPPVMHIDDAYVSGGSCTSGAGVIQCQLGDIAGGAAHAVHLVLRSDVIGSNSISARIESSSDASTANNSGDGTIVIEPEADLGVALHGPGAASTTDAFVVSYTVTNQAMVSAADIVLTITAPAGVTVAQPTLANGTCAVEAAAVRCTLGSLAGGARAGGSVALSATVAGSLALRASVSGSYVDPNSANDLADLSVAVGGAAQRAEERGRGGGGSTNLLFLLATAVLTRLRRRTADNDMLARVP